MALQREPMKEVETYARENNVNHGALLDAVSEYMKQLRADSMSKKEKELPECLRHSITAFHGDIKWIKDRKDNKGYFIVTHDEEMGYQVVMVDDTEEGYSFLAIDDFPEQEQAIDYILVLEKSMQAAHPKHHQLSELKLIQVNDESYYVGRERYDSNAKKWFPLSRVNSKPIETRFEAESFLQKVLTFRTDVMNLSTGNLKVLATALHEAILEDPWNEFKRNVVIDELRSNRKLKPHMLAELCQERVVKE